MGITILYFKTGTHQDKSITGERKIEKPQVELTGLLYLPRTDNDTRRVDGNHHLIFQNRYSPR